MKTISKVYKNKGCFREENGRWRLECDRFGILVEADSKPEMFDKFVEEMEVMIVQAIDLIPTLIITEVNSREFVFRTEKVHHMNHFVKALGLT